MTQTPALLSFEDFLQLDDGTDKRYELVNGKLVEMPPTTRRHRRIAKFLETTFDAEIKRQGKNWDTARGETAVPTQGSVNGRYPDVIVFDATDLDPLELDALKDAPLLVVEIVSKGKTNATRDYDIKKSEYADIGTPEYWIVDPWQEKITVLLLVEGKYQEKVFTVNQPITSVIFPQLILTTQLILSA